MMVWYYEPTFDGLLSTLFAVFARKCFPDALLPAGAVAPMLQSQSHTVDTCEVHAERVHRHLLDKLGPSGLEQVKLAWLSEEPDSGMLLLRYLDLIVRKGGKVQRSLADPVVLAVHKMARRVNGERHLLSGFVRFQKTGEDIYFSAIAPRHNVLPLLVDHFADRFGSMRWILYDRRRDYGVFWDGTSLRPMEMDPTMLDGRGNLPGHLLADDEKLFQNLWKSYFAAIAIEERRNPKLQARCMPRRFWRYMTELGAPTDGPRSSST